MKKFFNFNLCRVYDDEKIMANALFDEIGIRLSIAETNKADLCKDDMFYLKASVSSMFSNLATLLKKEEVFNYVYDTKPLLFFRILSEGRKFLEDFDEKMIKDFFYNLESNINKK